MKMSSFISTAGAAALALAVSATASYAGYMQPGETLGVSLLSPLPEGVFAADLEDYGRSPGLVPGHSVGLGVNIPVLIWSTPITFYNTRLEFLAALPFAHLDGAGTDRVGFITEAYGPMLAHDFGGGLTGGVGAFVRTPDPSADIQELTGRAVPAVDLRESLQYKIPTGPFSGITLLQNAAWTSCLCSYHGDILTNAGSTAAIQNDMFAGDFDIQKSFNKLTVGFVGYGNIDTDNRAGRTVATSYEGNVYEKNVALGGLIGYDFGKFTLTGIVTRSLFSSAISPTVSVGAETRGWLRIIVPLYVAPTAPAPVVARY